MGGRGCRSGLGWVGLDFRLFIDSVMGGWRCMVLFCLVVVVGVLVGLLLMMLDWGWDGGDDVPCSGRIVSCGVGVGFSWVSMGLDLIVLLMGVSYL